MLAGWVCRKRGELGRVWRSGALEAVPSLVPGALHTNGSLKDNGDFRSKSARERRRKSFHDDHGEDDDNQNNKKNQRRAHSSDCSDCLSVTHSFRFSVWKITFVLFGFTQLLLHNNHIGVDDSF